MENKIKVVSLASGSSGNSVYVSSGSDEILIDAGVSCKCIRSVLNGIGTDISRIKAVFVTHEHIDHVKGLDVLTRKYGIPVHIVEACYLEYKRKYKKELKGATLHPLSFCETVGNLKITSFFSPHDSAACVGYKIETDSDSFGLATDLGYVDRRAVEMLTGCGKVILESNYDEKMLVNGSYTVSLKRRIMSECGHLSNYDCAAFARFLAERGTRSFMLAHLSEENNTPEIAYNISSRALKGFDVSLKIAERLGPTEM